MYLMKFLSPLSRRAYALVALLAGASLAALSACAGAAAPAAIPSSPWVPVTPSISTHTETPKPMSRNTYVAERTPPVPARTTPSAPSVLVTPMPAPFGVGGPLQQTLPTLDPGQYPPGTPEVPAPGTTPGPVQNPVTSIINYLIQATIYFPAKTFQRAVEKRRAQSLPPSLRHWRSPFAK